jgi:hypothetical protein
MIFPLVSLCALQAQADPKNELIKVIVGLHTRIYGVDNLLLQPFATKPSDDVKDWRDMMENIAGFVDASVDRKELKKMLATLNGASEMLITERKWCWEVVIEPCMTGPGKIDLRKLTGKGGRFKELVESDSKLHSRQKGLDDTLAAITRQLKTARSQDTRDALEVLNRLALTLQATVAKYHNDVVKLKKG